MLFNFPNADFGFAFGVRALGVVISTQIAFLPLDKCQRPCVLPRINQPLEVASRARQTLMDK